MWTRFAVPKGLNPMDCSISEAASGLLTLHSMSPAQARNAFAVLRILPGYQGIRFCPLLTQLKKECQNSTQKYATFWDPEPLLKVLSKGNIYQLSLLDQNSLDNGLETFGFTQRH